MRLNIVLLHLTAPNPLGCRDLTAPWVKHGHLSSSWRRPPGPLPLRYPSFFLIPAHVDSFPCLSAYDRTLAQQMTTDGTLPPLLVTSSFLCPQPVPALGGFRPIYAKDPPAVARSHSLPGIVRIVRRRRSLTSAVPSPRRSPLASRTLRYLTRHQ